MMKAPAGFRYVAIRPAIAGEWVLEESGNVFTGRVWKMKENTEEVRIIIEPIPKVHITLYEPDVNFLLSLIGDYLRGDLASTRRKEIDKLYDEIVQCREVRNTRNNLSDRAVITEINKNGLNEVLDEKNSVLMA